VVSVQLALVAHGAVLLIIRRSWVRAPPAPPAIYLIVRSPSWISRPEREGCEGYIRRTIKPALGNMQVRKVRGPVLDMFYARLKKCGDLACNGRPFTEHRNVPTLKVGPADRRPAWRQVVDALRDAIQARGASSRGATAVNARVLRTPGHSHEHAKARVLSARGRGPDSGPAGAYRGRRR
jgi:hypothetical protein